MRPKHNLDEDRTLRVLLAWPAMEKPYPTSLVEKCEIALNSPLSSLTREQIRLLVGQQFGLEYVMPKALAILAEDPLVGVTYYDGDLLSVCLQVNRDFWATAPKLREQLQAVVDLLDMSSSEVMRLSEELADFEKGMN